MGNEKHVDPKWIATHSTDIENYVVTMVEAARTVINGDGVFNLEGGDFSITLSGAAAGYPTAAQFAFQNVEALKKDGHEMVKKLVVTARNYANSEQANAGK